MAKLETSILQKEKRCIFCGNPPSKKNKEHVIPRWLIGLTGDPNRAWHLGVKFGDPDKPARRFAADRFQFPACETCNTRYASLEGRTKTNMTKLLNEQMLDAAEWDDLLDWFDKVRIGLFIGNMILNKDLPIPDPHFFIDQRIGAKDRCVLVYPIRGDHTGLRMIGAGDPVFFHLPGSFMLLVNKLLFLNISSDFLLAARMGFPFPRATEMKGNQLGVSDFTAILRPKLPFIRFSFYRPKIAVYQTILMKELLKVESYESLTHDEYIQTNLLPKSLRSQLAVDENGKPEFLAAKDKVTHVDIPEAQIKTYDQYCLRFFEYRRVALLQAFGTVDPAARGMVKLMRKFNDDAISQTNAGVYSM